MARRYRYSFTKKKEAKKGKLSAGLAAASFLLFITAVVLAYLLDDSFGFLVAFLRRAEAIKPVLSVRSAMDCF